MADFDELLATANDLLDEREKDKAGPALDAAFAAARTPGEQALALNGMAFLRENSGEMLELLERSIALAETRLNADPQDSRANLALADALFEQAMRKFDPSDREQQLATVDRSLARLLEPACRPQHDKYGRQFQRIIAQTLWHKGFLLADEPGTKALDCYTDLLRRFRHVDDRGVAWVCANAAVDRAIELAILGRSDEQIAAYNDVIARYGPSNDRRMRSIVLRALEQKLLAYREQEDFEAVVEVCDDLLARYEDDPAGDAADAVARTLIRKGDVLNRLGKMGQELGCYDRVIATWGTDDDAGMRKHAGEALLAKATVLSEADQAGAEMECYEELLRRYADDKDETVRAVAADGLVHKGLSLRAIAEDAAEDTGVLETDDEIACYDQVIARYGDETGKGLRRAVLSAFFHKGESLLETGRRAEAGVCLDMVIAERGSSDRFVVDLANEARRLRAEF